MGRNIGTFTFSGNFDVLSRKPFDSRFLVDSQADLVKPETWLTPDNQEYTYQGMVVACLDKPGKLYQLIDPKNYTSSSAWKEIADEKSMYGGVIDVSIDSTFVDFEKKLKLEASNGQKQWLFIVSNNDSSVKGGKVTLTLKWTKFIFGEDKIDKKGASIGDLLLIALKEGYNSEKDFSQFLIQFIPIYEAEAATGDYPGNEGRMSVYDKTQVNKIAGLEYIWNYLLQTREGVQKADDCIYTGVYPYIPKGTPENLGWGTIFTSATKDADSNGYYSLNQTFVYRAGTYKEPIYFRTCFYKDKEYQWGDWVALSHQNNTTETVALAKTIQVTGTPLAEILNKQQNITSIDTEEIKTIQDLLQLLFTKENYPKITYTPGTITATIPAPNFTVASPLVEVNEKVNISSCSAASVNYTSTPRKYSGISYGYTTDKISKITDTEIIKKASDITYEGQYTIKRTGAGPEESKSGSNLEEIQLDATQIVAKEGPNTVKVSVEGPKVICNFPEIPEFWVYSNLNQLSEQYEKKESATRSTSNPSNSKSITITGVYPIYATTESVGQLTKQPLQSSKEYILTLSKETNTDKQKFAIPKTYQIDSVKLYNTFSNTWEDYNINHFLVTDTILQSGNVDTKYSLYTKNEGKTGQSKFKIILK